MFLLCRRLASRYLGSLNIVLYHTPRCDCQLEHEAVQTVVD